jgi:hypothetical protein
VRVGEKEGYVTSQMVLLVSHGRGLTRSQVQSSQTDTKKQQIRYRGDPIIFCLANGQSYRDFSSRTKPPKCSFWSSASLPLVSLIIVSTKL